MIYAKKSYGQHFLKNDSIAARVAAGLQRAAEVGRVLEIGPGTGMLTRQLLAFSEFETWAIEADPDMVVVLQNNIPSLANRLIFNDFMQFDPATVFGKNQFCLVGNFPYNISSQILFRLLDLRRQIPEMVGMFQKEVADRVVAPPGSKVYGITSVICQAFFRADYLFTVEPGSFVPPPKVRSAVIRLTRKDGFELGCDEALFRKMVKTAFNQRRKMLRNTLKEFFPERDLMAEPFFQKRPEELGWEVFRDLAASKLAA